MNNNTIMTFFRVAIIAVALLAAGLSMAGVPARAAGKAVAALPEPLTLEDALSLAGEGHPDLVQAQADLEQAQAERDGVEADNNVHASLQGHLRWVDPSAVSSDQGHDDTTVGLYITKRLFDFGRTSSRLSAAVADVKSRRLLYTDARSQHRIDIMAAYFAVLLADLQYSRDNEAMAVAYVNLDKLRDRRKLGQISDIAVSKAESEYQQVRSRRYASDVRRRSSRARLALVLNRPGMLPSTLAKPDLPGLDRKLPDVQLLQQEALRNNPRLQALRERVQAARERLQAARAGGYPVIDGEVETLGYSREFGSSDRVRAGITFKVPLYTGGAVTAQIARQQAIVKRIQAQLTGREMDVRQAVLDAWQGVYVLHAQQDEARAASDYRDLYLDRSRALYELDVKTDLGDSMVQITAAQLRTAKTDYELALTLAKLDALLGRPVFANSQPAAAKP